MRYVPPSPPHARAYGNTPTRYTTVPLSHALTTCSRDAICDIEPNRDPNEGFVVTIFAEAESSGGERINASFSRAKLNAKVGGVPLFSLPVQMIVKTGVPQSYQYKSYRNDTAVIPQ